MQRLVLTFALFVACTSIQAKEWAFDVYLDKTKMGSHTFSLNDANQMTSRAKFKVKVLFVEAYSYNQIGRAHV